MLKFKIEVGFIFTFNIPSPIVYRTYMSFTRAYKNILGEKKVILFGCGYRHDGDNMRIGK